MILSFQIQPANIDTANASLFLEINAQGLSYTILENNTCLALVVYHFNAAISDETTAEYIHQVIANQPVLQQNFNQVHIIYGYAPSILVPEQFVNDADNRAMLELLYGDVSERVTRTDLVEGHATHNVYGIPAVIEMVITRYFDAAGYRHLFSLLPGVIKEAGNHLYCIFGRGHLKVLLIKENKLQLMQSYSYRTPDDVAYHLLSLCNGFDVSIGEVTVHLSGMIDVNSPLYTELYKYVTGLLLEGLPHQYQYPEEIQKYPGHYFSHLFAVATCV